MYESGYYNGEVVWQGFGASKQKETPSFDLQFKIKERFDPVTQELSPVTEGVRTIHLYLSDATMQSGGITYEAFKVLGVYGDMGDYNPDNPGHRSLLGKVVKLQCKHRTYQDKLKDDWFIVTGTGKRKNNSDAAAKIAAMVLPPLPPPPSVEESTTKSSVPPADDDEDDIGF